MATSPTGVSLRRALALLIPLMAWLALAGPARAQDDPPGRVGRIADLQGAVSWFDHEQGGWTEAQRNLPLTGGDRLSTGPDARAELRIGSTTLRLGAGTELEMLRLDDERISVQLHSGNLAVRVRSREVANEIELQTQEARLLPLTAGHYRLDRIDDSTQVASWRGDLRIDDPSGFVVVAGQRVELYREGRQAVLRFRLGAPANDAFAAAVQREDQRDERSVSARYVSPEMTGAEELDRNGRWDQHPEYGAIWLPLTVRAGWAPYRDGRWVWVRPWGWTWVDEAPWGFAPFHYGRWVYWRNSWAWVPGAYVARPVFAPALVGWIGGNGFGVSIGIGGGPRVGWVPLAPREVYVPHYSVTPRYRERINPAPPYRWEHGPHDAPRAPERWGNQAAPGAVSEAPRGSLEPRWRGVERPVDRRWGTGPEARDGRDGRDSRDGREGRDERRIRGGEPAIVAPVMPVFPTPGQGASGPGRTPRPAEPRPERAERPERPDRPERTDRPERPERPDRASGPVMQPGVAPPQVQPAAPLPAPVAAPVPPLPQAAQPVVPAAPVGPPEPRRVRPMPLPQASLPVAPAPAPPPAAAAPPAQAVPAPAPAPMARPAVERPRDVERERERVRERERDREAGRDRANQR